MPMESNIEKSKTNTPRVFDISFKQKKNYSKETPRSMGLRGGLASGLVKILCPYLYVMYEYVHTYTNSIGILLHLIFNCYTHQYNVMYYPLKEMLYLSVFLINSLATCCNNRNVRKSYYSRA